jgi:hypothetical protein
MDYRIICTVQEPASVPTSHAHIVAVGTGVTADRYSQRWTVAEVYSAMTLGDTFHTVGVRSGVRADVSLVNCSHCERQTLRSTGDVVTDNNLDSLPRCS